MDDQTARQWPPLPDDWGALRNQGRIPTDPPSYPTADARGSTASLCKGMPNNIHYLKTWPEFFYPIKRGEKTFEVRRNDRGFEPGDTIVLELFDPNHGYLLKDGERERLWFRTDYVLKGPAFGIEEGHCVFSLVSTAVGGPGGNPEAENVSP